jgi:WD40 repeat protein
MHTFEGHTGSLRTIDSHYDAPDVYITAGRDGEIMLYDVRLNNETFYE